MSTTNHRLPEEVVLAGERDGELCVEAGAAVLRIAMEPEPPPRPLVLFDDGRRAVGAAVIDHDELEVGSQRDEKLLSALDVLGDIVLFVESPAEHGQADGGDSRERPPGTYVGHSTVRGRMPVPRHCGSDRQGGPTCRRPSGDHLLDSAVLVLGLHAVHRHVLASALAAGEEQEARTACRYLEDLIELSSAAAPSG